MHIVKLTPAVEKRLLRARQGRDAEAGRVASEIVADVRKRGNAALFAWAKKLDGTDLRRENLWISERDIRGARKQMPPHFVRSIKHAARNVRRLAKELVVIIFGWILAPTAGVSLVVRPIESIGCYV